MFYAFPIIKKIDDVLAAIAGAPEFIVAEKDGYKVVNYMVNKPDTFPPINGNPLNAVRRECRGVKFDSVTGNIIARPYHKFFNVGERSETLMENINFNYRHTNLNKLDGSMIHPMMVNGVIRWATKMGITDTSMQAEEFIALNPIYQELANNCIHNDFTPIFEWCSNKNRIVLDYPRDQLILTAVRHMIDGTYFSYSSIKAMGETWKIPIVEKSKYSIIEIGNAENIEGIALRFDNGHMVKIKSEWYVLRHKSKDTIMREKNVLEYITTDKVDDVIPFLIEADAAKLRDYQIQVEAAIRDTASLITMEYSAYVMKAQGSRKAFAEMNKGLYKNFIFKMLDGRPIYDELKKYIAAKCGTQTGVDNIRHLIVGLEWKY